MRRSATSSASRAFVLMALLALATGCGERETENASLRSPNERGNRTGPTVALDLFTLATRQEPSPEPVHKVAAPTRIDVAGQYRRSLRVFPATSLEWEFRVPPAGAINFGAALHPDVWVLRGDGIFATFEVVDGRRHEQIWSQWICPRDVPDHRGWLDADLDLSRWSGRRVTLRLSCFASPPAHSILRPQQRDRGESLLISTPLVYSAPSSAEGSDVERPPNVLIIVVDTLRDDALHRTGDPKLVSPRIDEFATGATEFRRAWATSPWTHPSTATLLSGWTPWQHGLGQGPAGTTVLNPETPMVAESFHRAGYATAAFSGNSIVSPDEGFARGFDHFDVRAFENEQAFSAQRVTRTALEWLGHHRRQPFFTYLHYFDPHDRYQAPAPFTRRFVDGDLDAQKMSGSIRQGRANPLVEGLEEGFAGFRVKPDELRYLRGLYDGEVAYVDHWIGVLLDQLREWGVLDRTLIVLTSDHGEEFYEHGFFKHGHALYEELTAVPLLIRMPGAQGGAAPWASRVDTPVSLLDLAPTLLDLTGLSRTPETLARSWRPILESTATGPRPPLLLANYSRAHGAWAGRQRGLIQWPWKWFESRDPDAEYLFDLSQDPQERNNLAEQLPERCDLLERLCTELYGTPDELPHTNTSVDPARLEKLKAMGYVH